MNIYCAKVNEIMYIQSQHNDLLIKSFQEIAIDTIYFFLKCKNLQSKEVSGKLKMYGQITSHSPSHGKYLTDNLKIRTIKYIMFLRLRKNVNVDVNQRSNKKKF